jgi:hypothetical protein
VFKKWASACFIFLSLVFAGFTTLGGQELPYYDFVWKLDGNSPNPARAFGYPTSIAIDSQNNLYVADDVRYRVLKFDKDGNFLHQLGGYGTEPGMFDHTLLNIAIDKYDNVYIACGWSSIGPRVAKFGSAGNLLDDRIVTRDGAPLISLDIDPAHNIYLTNTNAINNVTI